MKPQKLVRGRSEANVFGVSPGRLRILIPMLLLAALISLIIVAPARSSEDPAAASSGIPTFSIVS
ncbi:MAG TPA: hypothetical protein VF434_04795, partial [Promineifilum sp.]